MTWLAFSASLAFPLLILVTESDQLGAVAVPFYTFTTSCIAAYFGFATVDDKWRREAEGVQDASTSQI